MEIDNNILSQPVHSTPVRRMYGQALDAIIAASFALSVGYGIKHFSGNESLGSVFMVAVFLIYILFSDGLPNGQSLAKRLLGIRVVHADKHTPCTYGQSFFRNITGVFGIFDWFSIMFKSRRRAGDHLANTIVIKNI